MQSTIDKQRQEATKEVQSVMRELESAVPGITEGIATSLGATAGGGASYAALVMLGKVGLSGAGITSGLAAAGSLVGGGMVAGIGVLAAPVAALAVGGYAIAKHLKNKKTAAALVLAVEKLYAIQERLMKNAEYFKEEIAGIKALVETLKQRKK